MQIINNIGNSFKKNRTLWIGGAVLLGVVVLFMVMRPGGGGGQSVAVAGGGPSDAQVAINAELQSQQMQIQGSLAIAGMQAQAQANAAAGEMAAMTLDVYRQATQSQADLAIASINANTNMSITHTNAMKDINLANIYSGVEMNSQNQATIRQQSRDSANASIFGSLFGAIGGIFSDTKPKKNIKSEGYRAKGFFGKQVDEGLPEYSYEYSGGFAEGRHFGVMAQDALNSNPGAVYSRGRGLEVAYGRLS
jgi:hypothetical protein